MYQIKIDLNNTLLLRFYFFNVSTYQVINTLSKFNHNA